MHDSIWGHADSWWGNLTADTYWGNAAPRDVYWGT